MAPTYNSAKEDTTTGTSTRTRSSKTKSAKMMKQRDNEEPTLTVTSQVWQRSGKCPEGTIPVRRIQKRELLKAHSIDEYGRKKPSFSHRQVGHLNQSIDSFVQLQNHSVSLCSMVQKNVSNMVWHLFFKTQFDTRGKIVCSKMVIYDYTYV